MPFCDQPGAHLENLGNGVGSSAETRFEIGRPHRIAGRSLSEDLFPEAERRELRGFFFASHPTASLAFSVTSSACPALDWTPWVSEYLRKH